MDINLEKTMAIRTTAIVRATSSDLTHALFYRGIDLPGETDYEPVLHKLMFSINYKMQNIFSDPDNSPYMTWKILLSVSNIMRYGYIGDLIK